MRKLFLTFMSIIPLLSIGQQAPGIEWEKSLGGTTNDQAHSIKATPDGGSIVVGRSNSTNTHITNPLGSFDYWVAKLDSEGGIQWQKNYGGSGIDIPYSVYPTSDSGYIIAGTTNSNNGNITAPKGNYDYWIVKVDAVGTIQWEKSYGGSNVDTAYDIKQTSDSGFIVVGSSDSNDGDITGNLGNSDYWILKLDAGGELEWQKSYGGSSYDIAHSVVETGDSGFMIVGESFSSDGNITSPLGGNDYWVIKLDASGALEWEKNYGGTGEDVGRSIIKTADNAYAIAGTSNSTDNDITGNIGETDIWVVKIDILGNIIWQKNYGGTANENIGLGGVEIIQTAEGGLVVAASTLSGDGNLKYNNGGADFFVFNIAADSGNLNWHRNLGGTSMEYAWSVAQSTDGKILVAGLSASTNRDITANFDTSWYNYWVVKLGDHIPVENVDVFSVAGNESSIFIYDNIQLNTTVTPQYAPSGIAWSVTSGEEFITLSNAGIATGIAPGTAVIRAASIENAEIYGEYTLHVLAPSWGQLGSTLSGQAFTNPDHPEVKQSFFGYSIDLSADGSIMAVGAPTDTGTGMLQSYAAVFRFQEGEWVQIGGNIMGAAPIVETSNSPRAGMGVSLSDDGNILAVGETDYRGLVGNEIESGGRVRIFQNMEGQWVQIGNEIAQTALPNMQGSSLTFGNSVSLSAEGDKIAIGAPYHETNGQMLGSTRVYGYSAGEWTQLGSALVGEQVNEYFGGMVALSGQGEVLAISSQQFNGTAGRARVYKWTNNDWELTGTFSGATYSSSLRDIALSADGNRLVFGTEQTFPAGGNVQVHEYANGSWTQVGSISGTSYNDKMGYAVDISADGTIIATTAGTGYFGSPAQVKVFKQEGSSWVQVDNNITVTDGAFFYNSIALSSDASVVAVGAPQPIYETIYQSGRAYVYYNCNLSKIQVATTTVGEAVCTGSTVEASATALAPWYSDSARFNWYDNEGATEPIFTGAEITTAALTGTTSFWVEAVSPIGCPSERVEVVFLVNDKTTPVTTFSYPDMCTTDTTVQPIVAADFTLGGEFYATADIKVDPATGVIDASASTAGTYSIFYKIDENIETCTDLGVYEFKVTINACNIQRGISPNGDNLNDTFDLTGQDVKKLNIYNRYGTEVYAKTNYLNEWGGQDKNDKQLPTGTYFYTIEKKNGGSLTGWIYINREQ